MRRSLVRCVLAVAGALTAAAVPAQTTQPQEEQRPAADSQITSQRLRPGLHVLMSGKNGNVGV